MATERLPNIHPGEVLEEEFLKPLGITHYRIAKDLGVHQRRIDEIVRGRRAVTPETALLLGVYLGTSPRLWLGLQNDYDLEEVEAQLADRLAAIPRPRRAEQPTAEERARELVAV